MHVRWPSIPPLAYHEDDLLVSFSSSTQYTRAHTQVALKVCMIPGVGLPPNKDKDMCQPGQGQNVKSAESDEDCALQKCTYAVHVRVVLRLNALSTGC